MNMERLSEPLDAARVKTREGSGGRSLSYIESHDAIRTANEIFGFGNWGTEVVELRLINSVTVHNREQQPGVCVGYLCIVRLSVGTGDLPYLSTSGVGYGDATEYREGSAVTAHELAAKEAESDAMKRALKNWGDQWGLALYSKSAASDGHLSGAASTGSSTTVQNSAPGTMPFGKHKGVPFADVPAEYLDWVLAESKDQGVKDAIITWRLSQGDLNADPEIEALPF